MKKTSLHLISCGVALALVLAFWIGRATSGLATAPHISATAVTTPASNTPPPSPVNSEIKPADWQEFCNAREATLGA